MKANPSRFRSSLRRGRRSSFLQLERLEARHLLAALVSDIGSQPIAPADLLQAGVGLLPAPQQVAQGVWLLATGLPPADLELNQADNANAADTTNADQLLPGGGLGLNLTGAGLSVGVWDSGRVRNTHQEFG